MAATVKIDLRTVLALPGYSNVQRSTWARYTFLSGGDKYDQACFVYGRFLPILIHNPQQGFRVIGSVRRFTLP